MNSVCRRRSVGSKRWLKCSVKSVRSVREKSPQRVVCVLSHREDAFYFSQSNTEEQNTQVSTETLSQPISQNLTATFSSNALWTLYAGGVLWARNVRQKPPWTLCALWEKKLPSVLFVCYLIERVRSISHRVHRWTEHTKVHRDIKSTDFTEPYSQR